VEEDEDFREDGIEFDDEAVDRGGEGETVFRDEGFGPVGTAKGDFEEANLAAIGKTSVSESFFADGSKRLDAEEVVSVVLTTRVDLPVSFDLRFGNSGCLLKGPEIADFFCVAKDSGSDTSRRRKGSGLEKVVGALLMRVMSATSFEASVLGVGSMALEEIRLREEGGG